MNEKKNEQKNNVNEKNNEPKKNEQKKNEQKNDIKTIKEKNENNINAFLDSKISKNGALIDGKHPIFGSVKVGEIKGKKNTLEIYDYPLNIEYSSKEEAISVLFVGQSGTGKSTFINAFINHLLGITSSDNIRYKLIFGDKSKEKDQTQSQTDFITIYNIRSYKYNRLFKLIDTPGAGDTRNQNEQQISQIEKDQKEKEFLEMYNNLFSKDIGQLNSITFVIKASENRENEFQKKIIKNITNLFAGDVEKNCLAILTHTDNDEIIPDAVPLLEKLDFFKKKSQKEEEWYFPVSSPSYFIPFKKGTLSTTEPMFNFTENSFINYTKKILSLKVYYTKQTQKNLELKNKQENIIKELKENILNNLFSKIKDLKDKEIILKQKIIECSEKQKEIEEIKKQIENEDNLRKEIQQNYEVYTKSKAEKEEELNKNKDKIKSLTDETENLDKTIKELDEEKIRVEKEKQEAEERQRKYKEEIDNIQVQIRNKELEIEKKRNENIKTEEMKNLENSLEAKKNIMKTLDDEIKEKQKQKNQEMQNIQNSLESAKNVMLNLEEDMRRKEQQKNEEMKKIQESIEKAKKEMEELDQQINKQKNEKSENMKNLEIHYKLRRIK